MDIFENETLFILPFAFAKSGVFKKFGFCLLLIGPGFEFSLSKDFSLPFFSMICDLSKKGRKEGRINSRTQLRNMM